MLRAGGRVFRVSLQAPTGTSGYIERAIEWASIKPIGGSEALRFGGQASFGRYEIEIPYRSDVRGEWRVVDGQGREFQVTNYADPDGSRASLQLFCQELQ